MLNKTVKIIGAGLAGCEAAYQLSRRGFKCLLYDIKPASFTPAHSDTNFAELVCSNSLKGMDLSTSSGLLKQELRLLGSLCISVADDCAVPAGGALAVDRRLFAQKITQTILNDKNICFTSQEITDFDQNTATIIASGPLTTAPLLKNLQTKLGAPLYFYDAAAPIVLAESVDFSSAFYASRYGKGNSDDYVNCPLTKDEYQIFVQELINAKRAVLHQFEKSDIFEGCMPIEVMASRGFDAIRFGPVKPVGIFDKEGKRPYAVVQLRRENALGQMFNLVGFQTNLTFGEQERVFRLIPALKNAEFLRYGVMHRNSFINAPLALNTGFLCKKYPNIYIAGQLSGVEGYCESIMSGLLAALNLAENFIAPQESMCGALSRYITLENKNFQPMNSNFGLLPPLISVIKDKKQRKIAMAQRALDALKGCLIAK